MSAYKLELERFDPEMPHETICLTVDAMELNTLPQVVVYEGENKVFHGVYELETWEGTHALYKLVESVKI